MRCAAFDVSSETGAAAWDGLAPAPHLEKKKVLDWGVDDGLMLEGWRTWLGTFFAAHQPEAVGIEGFAQGGHGDALTFARQAMLVGMVQWACHVWEIPRDRVFLIAPASWRKSFIGFGSKPKKKDQPKEYVDWKALAKRRCRQLGWDYLGDHNVAEAAGVLDHLIAKKLMIVPPWRDQQREPEPSQLDLTTMGVLPDDQCPQAVHHG